MFVKGLILCCVIALTQAMFIPHPPKFGKKFPIKPIVQKKFVPIIKKVPIKVPHRVQVPVYIERKVEVPVYIDRPVPYPVPSGAVAGAGAIAGAAAGAIAGAGSGIDIAAKISDADHVNINVDSGLGAGAVAGAAAGAAAGAVADGGFENFNDFNNNGFEGYDMGFIGGQQDLVGGDFIGSQIPAQLPAQGHIQHQVQGHIELPAPKHKGSKGSAGHGSHFPEIAHAQDIVHF